MKKIFFTIIIIALTVGVSMAQNVRFGAKAGVNSTNFYGDDVDDYGSVRGFVIGGFVRFALSDKFDLQPELLYSQQGAEISMISDGINVDMEYKLDYINIPIVLKRNFNSGLNVHAGPQLGILTSAKVDWKAQGSSGDEDIKDELEDIDFSLCLGVGYEFTSGLGFDLRFNIGLTDIDDDMDGKHTVGQLTVSYAF